MAKYIARFKISLSLTVMYRDAKGCGLENYTSTIFIEDHHGLYICVTFKLLDEFVFEVQNHIQIRMLRNFTIV
ncbi:Hypothetical protein CINCED_3A021149 [Cinara cedri]|uniref:Uncharacterized protein n=1 Tax=Cinara cedri TaxID=506608 RepID=A0A5E4NJT1_9HEMI|nr:Hypothetical protein CINCED_3A021149 [Cinara cedri]